MSVCSSDKVSRNCSSSPEVGKYAVYARMLLLPSEKNMPQNLSDITGSFTTCLAISVDHPSVVPCQVVPWVNISSSGGVNISEDVERKLYPGKSVKSLVTNALVKIRILDCIA